MPCGINSDNVLRHCVLSAEILAEGRINRVNTAILVEILIQNNKVLSLCVTHIKLSAVHS